MSGSDTPSDDMLEKAVIKSSLPTSGPAVNIFTGEQRKVSVAPSNTDSVPLEEIIDRIEEEAASSGRDQAPDHNQARTIPSGMADKE